MKIPQAKNIILPLLLVLSILFIFFVGYLSAKSGNLTSEEAQLYNLLLVFFSILASTITSHYYFEASNKQSLGLYAKKAAEKVSNLSSQLTKLSIYLQQGRSTEGENSQEALIVLQEHTAGAIHIVETLKSINDRSISDWFGILSEEEIKKTQDTIQAQEEEFREIVGEVKDLGRKSRYHQEIDTPSEELQHNIEGLNKRIEVLTTSIVGTPIDAIKREEVELKCPACRTPNTYKQKPKASSVKGFRCKQCDARLVSRWNSQEGFILYLKDTSTNSSSSEINEEILDKVKAELPKQPWPKGTAKEISEKLGLSNAVMTKAVDELIRRGDFKVQIDGVLYEPMLIKLPRKPTKAKSPRLKQISQDKL